MGRSAGYADEKLLWSSIWRIQTVNIWKTKALKKTSKPFPRSSREDLDEIVPAGVLRKHCSVVLPD